MKWVKVDTDGNKISEESVSITLDHKKKNVDHWLYSIIKYQQAKRHQGTASTKTRAEVRGGGAKPYKQKGTGRARRGTNRTPLRRGGGVIFGPKFRSYDIKMNNKHVRNTIKYVFQQKESEIVILANKDKEISTKKMYNLIASADNEKNQKVLFIVNKIDSSLSKSCRNIKNAIISTPTSLDVASFIKVSKIVIEEESLESLKEMLS